MNVKWLSNKTEEILLIKNVSVEYVKKRVPIFTQKYLCMDRMEEQVHYITIKKRKQKKIMTTTNVEDITGYFNVKLFDQNCGNKFLHKKLPINKDIHFEKISAMRISRKP